MGDTRPPEAKEAAEEKKAAVIRMRRDGMEFADIGAALDPPVSKQRAHQIYAEALKQIPALEVHEYRAEQEGRLDELLRTALDVMRRDHVAVSQGRVVRIGKPYIDEDTGQAAIDEGRGAPVLDDMPKLRAAETILKIEERRARLRGIDMPTKAKVEGNVQVEYTIVGVDPEVLK